MKRTLTLRRETLAELTSADLAGVAGAAPVPYTNDAITCPAITTCLSVDLSRLPTCHCMTVQVR
jgi:hypothetical protein